VLKHKGKLYFAGDRRISWHIGQAQISPRSKITFRHGILFAGTGTSVLCDTATDLFVPPKFNKQEDTYMYANTKFLPAYIKHLRKTGWINKGEFRLAKHTEGTDLSATILVGIGSDLYELDVSSDYIAMCPISTPFAAGCGGSLAWGALLALEKAAQDLTPEQKLTMALQAASEVSPGCDSNVDILHN
jgi:hypothetical protein